MRPAQEARGAPAWHGLAGDTTVSTLSHRETNDCRPVLDPFWFFECLGSCSSRRSMSAPLPPPPEASPRSSEAFDCDSIHGPASDPYSRDSARPSTPPLTRATVAAPARIHRPHFRNLANRFTPIQRLPLPAPFPAPHIHRQKGKERQPTNDPGQILKQRLQHPFSVSIKSDKTFVVPVAKRICNRA